MKILIYFKLSVTSKMYLKKNMLQSKEEIKPPRVNCMKQNYK